MNTRTNLLCLLCVLAFATCNKKPETDPKEIAEEQNEKKFDTTNLENDSEFAVAAASGGLLEVKLGELALVNGSSAGIKKFGQSMVDDHTKANMELMALAQQKQISIPATLSEKHQQKYDELSKKTGEEFDRAYAEYMVEDHKEDIDAFKKQAEKGNDSDLKAWAETKIPTLEHHLAMAETVEKEVDPK